MLEKVEEAFGTTEQSIKSISKINLQPGCGWLDIFRATTSRMTRQREMVTSVNIDCFHIFEDAIQVFATLMQAQEVSFGLLSIGLVGGKIREILSEKSWQVVAAAFQGNLVVGTAFIARQELAEARRETILRIWDATSNMFAIKNPWRLGLAGVGFLQVDKTRYDRDQASTRLLQISNMTDSDFHAELRNAYGEYSEGGAEVYGEDGGENEEETGGEDDGEGDGEGDGEDDGEDDGEWDFEQNIQTMRVKMMEQMRVRRTD